jgi:large subunit ribosomal protein L1
MATARPCLAQLSRICLPASRPGSVTPTRFLSTTVPLASRAKIVSKKEKPASGSASKYKKKKGEESGKKKKTRTTYKQYDMRDAEIFTLCDAMRYVSYSDPSIFY